MNINKKVKNGDIWMAEIPFIEKIGSVQYGKRPIYICSNDKFNMYSPVVNYYPITSQLKKNSLVHIVIDDTSGLKMKSVIMVERMGTIDKNNLLKKIGKCTYKIKNKVLCANLFQTGYLSQDKYKEKLACI